MEFKINYETGEGTLTQSEKFSKQDALFRLDILKDLVEQSAALYTQTLEEIQETVFKK